LEEQPIENDYYHTNDESVDFMVSSKGKKQQDTTTNPSYVSKSSKHPVVGG